ncbi:type I-F CRISPR-associated protein Csy2 [Seleniivibrio woodruffii]|uniref:type I-F CRISPR-associated protein Csy2 n=1 Tax=Seleniivibrio woodruffii TaxID=1078050 RepID=UPI0039E60FDD
MHKIPDHLLVLPRMRVINVNCVSGPLTWGFPSVTAFCGFVHALSRKLGGQTVLDGVGIISHSFEPQAYQSGYEKRFSQTRNPLESDGSTAGIIEEGRAHVTVSLIIGVYGGKPDADETATLAGTLRLAGGSILPVSGAKVISLDKFAEQDGKTYKKLARKLLPGFTLTDRSDLLMEHHKNMPEEKTLLDALLDLSAMKHGYIETEGSKGEWQTYREGSGWLVPIPVGYAGISPLYQPGEVANTRDKETPFRFAEAIYTLGEWKSPSKLKGLDELLWFYSADTENGIYACKHKKIYE